MPSYNCKHPTCGKILPALGYCDEHKPTAVSRHRLYDQSLRNQESKKFYDSAAWQAVRAAKLQQSPVCEDCKREWAKHVHHNKPISTHPALKLEITNLKALCHSCHSKLEAQRRASACSS